MLGLACLGLFSMFDPSPDRFARASQALCDFAIPSRGPALAHAGIVLCHSTIVRWVLVRIAVKKLPLPLGKKKVMMRKFFISLCVTEA
jgi:hypothetical protein